MIDAPDSIGPASDSLCSNRNVVRLCTRWSVPADCAGAAASIGNRWCVLRWASHARTADSTRPSARNVTAMRWKATIGSPLAGDSFLSNWSARPLTNLVDKIQKTMPFNLPGSLSRQQSTDLAAYILQVGKFPAGQTELNEAMLAQIAFPAAITAPLLPPLPPPRRRRRFRRRKETLPS